jgi:hypothetical protein
MIKGMAKAFSGLCLPAFLAAGAALDMRRPAPLVLPLTGQIDRILVEKAAHR